MITAMRIITIVMRIKITIKIKIKIKIITVRNFSKFRKTTIIARKMMMETRMRIITIKTRRKRMMQRYVQYLHVVLCPLQNLSKKTRIKVVNLVL